MSTGLPVCSCSRWTCAAIRSPSTGSGKLPAFAPVGQRLAAAVGAAVGELLHDGARECLGQRPVLAAAPGAETGDLEHRVMPRCRRPCCACRAAPVVPATQATVGPGCPTGIGPLRAKTSLVSAMTVAMTAARAMGPAGIRCAVSPAGAAAASPAGLPGRPTARPTGCRSGWRAPRWLRPGWPAPAGSGPASSRLVGSCPACSCPAWPARPARPGGPYDRGGQAVPGPGVHQARQAGHRYRVRCGQRPGGRGGRR